MARTKSPKSHIGTFPLAKDSTFLSLTTKQQKFVHNIFLQPSTGWSNTKCYSDAYPNAKQTSAGVEAHNSLKKPKIVSCITKLRDLYYDNLNVTPERVLEELSYIAFSDMAEYCDSNGHLTVHPTELPERARRALSGFTAIRQENGDIHYKYTLWNKLDGAKQLRQMVGMDDTKPQRVELSGPGGSPIRSESTVTHSIDFSKLDDTDLSALYQIVDKIS